jgi:hypothetical protein
MYVIVCLYAYDHVCLGNLDRSTRTSHIMNSEVAL